jgi:hypothetical protein
MARQIRVGLNPGKKEVKLSPMGLVSNGLRERLVRMMTTFSTDSGARTKAFEVEACQKNAYLEGSTLKRMQILR